MRWLRNGSGCRRAQALVEFILVFPMLLMFLAVVVDLGRLIHARLVMGEIVHDAARYASVRDPESGEMPSESSVRERAFEHLPPFLEHPNIIIDLQTEIAGQPAIVIKLESRVTPLIPLFSTVVGDSITLTESAFHPRRVERGAGSGGGGGDDS